MTSIYEAWLADRGIDSPGVQPCDVLDAGFNPASRGVIVAVSTESDRAGDADKITKLARALDRDDSRPFSWILVAGETSKLSVATLRNLMPTLCKVVLLDDACAELQGQLFKIEETLVASRKVETFFGPSLLTMNQDNAIKSLFWQQLRTWAV